MSLRYQNAVITECSRNDESYRPYDADDDDSGTTGTASSSDSTSTTSSGDTTSTTTTTADGGTTNDSTKTSTAGTNKNIFDEWFGFGVNHKYYDGGFEEKMTCREAALILGIRESSTTARIKDAHRKLLIINHPDTGGSTFLTHKINEAKELLLKGRTMK